MLHGSQSEPGLTLTVKINQSDSELLFSEPDPGDLSQEWVLGSESTGLGEDGILRIFNRALGGAAALSVINDGVYDQLGMTELSEFGGQDWRFTLLDDGYCRLTNDFLGPDIALDVTNNAPPRLMMEPVSNSSGQRWVATQLGRAEGPGTINFCSGMKSPS